MTLTANLFQMLLTGNERNLDAISATLQANYFTCSVGEDASGTDRYVVVKRDGNSIRVESAYNVVDLPLRDTLHQVSLSFEVVIVPVIPFAHIEANLQDIPAVMLRAEEGPSVMVTTQLTGCSLVYQPKTAAEPNARIAHIRCGADGSQLERDLRDGHARFAGQHVDACIWGKQEYNPHNGPVLTNVIGLRREQRWTLFAFTAPGKAGPITATQVPLYCTAPH